MGHRGTKGANAAGKNGAERFARRRVLTNLHFISKNKSKSDICGSQQSDDIPLCGTLPPLTVGRCSVG